MSKQDEQIQLIYGALCEVLSGLSSSSTDLTRLRLVEDMESLDNGYDVANVAVTPIIHTNVDAIIGPDAPLGRLEIFLHSIRRHPDYEYETTTGPRKTWTERMPEGDNWERNIYFADKGWERFEYHEEAYWMRKDT